MFAYNNYEIKTWSHILYADMSVGGEAVLDSGLSKSSVQVNEIWYKLYPWKEITLHSWQLKEPYQ